KTAPKTAPLDQPVLALKEFLTQGDHLKNQIPYHYLEYLELVDYSGRVIREGKRGAMDDRLPPILIRLGIDETQWHKAMQPKGAHQFSRAMGCCESLRAYANKLSIRWIKGMTLSGKLFPS
ncbi:transposase, partial [Gammaproteobacteria bacterium AS21]